MDNYLLKQLQERKDLQRLLFRRGWVISKKPIHHPLLGDWKHEDFQGWHFMWHPEAKCTLHKANWGGYFIEGQVYNPFTGECDEGNILEYLNEVHSDKGELIKRIDELTGVFVLGWIEGDEISFLTDAGGMQSAFYGSVDDNFIITSHCQIVDDIYNLESDPLAKELMQYKWYGRVTGAYLPADLSPFKSIKRIVPDILYCRDSKSVNHKRIWPLNSTDYSNGLTYDELISKSADILNKTMKCVAKKWPNASLSLTGGIDSNTLFAAANGVYDKIQTFSYVSAPKEVPDAAAAKKISGNFGVRHKEIPIPEDEREIEDFEIKSKIILHSGAYTHPLRRNEMRKRIWLEEHSGIELEVKGWVSETIRGACYHRYRRTSMPKMSPKLFRNLYKIFISNRSLAYKVDKLYENYIEKFEYHSIPEIYPPADMQFHEVAWGSWGGVSISEMKYCFDITVPYSNRILLDLLFHVPLEKRLSDEHHMDMKKILNKELYDMNVHVENVEETKLRGKLLNVIFTANMLLPF